MNRIVHNRRNPNQIGVILFLAAAIVVLLAGPANALSQANGQQIRTAQPNVENLLLLDSDGDGINDDDEATLGIDYLNVDSDCDYVDDLSEIGDLNAPTDADGDGIIDALESRYADADGDTVPDQMDAGDSAQVHCGRFYPFAVADGAEDQSRLEIGIAGGTAVTAVSAFANQQRSFMASVDGAEISVNEEITLFDDGTHGDRLAGDGVWSRGGFSVDGQLPDGRWDTFEFNVINVTDNGATDQFDLRSVYNATHGDIVLGIVHPNAVRTPISVTESIQTTPSLVNIADPRLSLVVKGAEDLKPATKRFYNQLEDLYDFLFFFPDSPTLDAPYGSFFNVQNSIQNIGINSFNETAAFGSAGRLQGTIFLNFGANGPTIHEVLHNWAAPDLSALGLSQCNVGRHWGAAGVGRGQHGGFDPATLDDKGGGSYTAASFGLVANGGDTIALAPLERYLAGFAGLDELAAFPTPVNVDCNSFDYSVAGQVSFKADRMKNVTTADLIGELGGERQPPSDSSQRQFQAAMVVVSQSLLTPAEMAFFNNRGELFGASTGDKWFDGFYLSFEEATGGRATMSTEIIGVKPEFKPTDFIYLPAILS